MNKDILLFRLCVLLLVSAIVILAVSAMNSATAVNDSAVAEQEPVDTVDNYVNDVHNSVDNPVVLKDLYRDKDIEILALIIYQEAGADTCSDDTRLKVGNVFLNRVDSPLFPDTFYEVATQKRQYGELYWTDIAWPSRAWTDDESHAVQRAYRIARRLLEGERVLPTNVIWQAEFIQGDGVYCYQDGIYFCYSEGIK